MINSQFLQLAQKYGLSKVPQTGEELMAALQALMTPDQLELVQYLFQPPEVFQQNPINTLLPQLADTGAVAVEPAPTKDNAAAQVTQPPSPEPGTAVAPTTGAPTGSQAPTGVNYPVRTTPETAAEKAYGDAQNKAKSAEEFAANKKAFEAGATTTAPSTAIPAATAARPWAPPVKAAPAGSVGTPVVGANASGASGYWDPGDATHPPRFIPSS